jgi:hypothetical protein
MPALLELPAKKASIQATMPLKTILVFSQEALLKLFFSLYHTKSDFSRHWLLNLDGKYGKIVRDVKRKEQTHEEKADNRYSCTRRCG